MGLTVSTEPLTPPLETSMLVNGSVTAQSTYQSILNYLNQAIMHHDSKKYYQILSSFVSSTYSYGSSKDMFLSFMTKIYDSKITPEELDNLDSFFVPNRTNGRDHEDAIDGSSSLTVCSNYDTTELSTIEGATFWTEGVIQTVIGVIGLVLNLTSIYILGCKKLESPFNRLLACLLMVHTMYICSTFANYIGRMYFTYTLVFAYFLYPLRPLALHASTFITVLMARQRFLAIRHPVEYRNSNVGVNPWKMAIKYMVLAILTCTVFVTPLLLETEVKTHVYVEKVETNATHIQYFNTTKQTISLADLRLNPNYVLWYKNVATTVITLLLPLILIGFWNFKTFSVMQRRSRLRNRPLNNCENSSTSNGSSTNPFIPNVLNRNSVQAKAEEARKAKVLFAIVIIFFICNIPRIIINLEESYGVILAAYKKESCYPIPFWAVILNCFSQLLITINASIGALVYCVMCTIFRAVMMSKVREWKAMASNLTSQLRKLLPSGRNEANNNEESHHSSSHV